MWRIFRLFHGERPKQPGEIGSSGPDDRYSLDTWNSGSAYLDTLREAGHTIWGGGNSGVLGASTVVLDPCHGDPEETRRPQAAWETLTTVATLWRTRS
jgi:hypothetical protein